MPLSDVYKPVPRRKMAMDTVYAAMNDDDKKLLLEILADPEVQSSTITRVLRAEGCTISEASVRAARAANWEPLV